MIDENNVFKGFSVAYGTPPGTSCPLLTLPCDDHYIVIVQIGKNTFAHRIPIVPVAYI